MSRNNAAAIAVAQFRQTGALKPLNKEFRARRLAGEILPSFNEFVAQRRAESTDVELERAVPMAEQRVLPRPRRRTR